MGVGNRMKKQGAPEPLSEAHFAKLKRKAGLPVEPVEAPEVKRRRRGAAPKANAAAAKKQDAKKSNGAKAGKPAPKAANGRGKKAPQPVDSDEEMSDDDDAGDFAGAPSDMSDDDDEVDEFSDLEAAEKLGDDFIDGSDDDSVYDSEEERGGGGKHMFSEDEDDSDGEEMLTKANIEGLARRLDQKQAEEDADAQAELEEMGIQTNIDGDKPHILEDDSDDELAAKTKTLLAPDLQLLRTRITENIRVLDDFAKLHEEGRSRTEYVNQLIKDICAYYGYSEYLAEKLFNLFSPREAFAFFEANESARPVVIRTNTLRTHRRDLAQALIGRGVTLEPVGKWSKVGLQIFESNVPLGATPEYLAGYYILQAASSFLPVMALEPQENERVLDMAAAPGGKTTHMAAMMKNTGVIVANDPSKQRAQGLIGNIHRLGARNVVVSNYDAREFPKPMGGFDRVLLDAPCSGTGVIAKDASVKTNKTERDFMLLPHMQKQLILAAIDSVNHHSKTGGYIVYSTCSVTVEENESVVAYALSRRPNVKLVDTNLPFGREGFTSYMGKKFDPSLKLTRRYYPHTYNVDGFFVAKFQKIGPTPAKAERDRSAASVGEVVDKTPITTDDESNAGGKTDDDFGGFDDDEDEEYVLKAKRNAMRRRGLDPNALSAKAKKAASDAKKESSASEAEAESAAETDKSAAEKTPEKKDKSKQKAAAADKEKKAERNPAQKKVTSTAAAPEKSPKSKSPKQKKEKKSAK
ncbi:NOL1/NOP2/sun family protein [Colletotrichum abscissum]|uniref:Nucleolar protein 2 n=1 Tax=Colletotrichum abscissum TaxID=1671311 RepID=A0A9Q0B873_9PEZI|nr:NOL1/NOP2/sun family protein [Colletotrichum abscissum]KAI3555482.1 NOL1/NOP2/sun family protein [Colletotrichum abscissum]KAK1478668.1 NOL1/NOP2/sun family protein [Colletotrichum abscissum]